jgi:hypothetical protein
MSQSNKRSKSSDDEENTSSRKKITPSKLRLPKKRKFLNYSPPIAQLIEKKEEIISLISSDEEEEGGAEGRKSEEKKEQQGEREENTAVNDNIQPNTSQPNKVDTKVPNTEPILITLDDSDDDNPNDYMETDQVAESNDEEKVTNNNLPVTEDESDELLSDSTDDDDDGAYLHRADPITKNSIHFIDKNTQEDKTSTKMHMSPLSVPESSLSSTAQHEEPNPIPVPSLDDKPRLDPLQYDEHGSKTDHLFESDQTHHKPQQLSKQNTPDDEPRLQHEIEAQEQSEQKVEEEPVQKPEQEVEEESEQDSEKEQEEEPEHQSQAELIVEEQLEAQDKSKVKFVSVIQSKSPPVTEHESSVIKDHKAPGSPPKSKDDGLEDLSNGEPLITSQTSLLGSLGTSLLPKQEIFSLTKGNKKCII